MTALSSCKGPTPTFLLLYWLHITGFIINNNISRHLMQTNPSVIPAITLSPPVYVMFVFFCIFINTLNTILLLHLLNMVKTKRDINQQDFKIVDLYFFKSNNLFSLEIVDRVSETKLQHCSSG